MKKKIILIEPLGFPWQTKDPFIFCAYHKDNYPAGDEQMGVPKEKLKGRYIGQDFTLKDGYRMYHGSHVPGFPYHPHRGFETITINKEGYVDHSDSLGAAGRFGAGDVQWMTAGKGVQHSEMFPLIHKEKQNPLEIFQIWLNLPRASKFVDPHFKMLWNETIPTITHLDDNHKRTVVDVISGEFNNHKAPKPTPDSWAAKTSNEVLILTVKMEAKATWVLPAAVYMDSNRTLYFYKGSKIDIENKEIKENHLIQLASDEDIVVKNGDQEGYLLLLQGRPINEPIVKYGPFVMNTEEEIQEAYLDYKQTQFGGWPWSMREQVHERNIGRFALHADGREEKKND